MTVNVFQPFETGLPSDDELIERLQQQNELLGQAIMPLYAGLGPQLDDQQDAIDLARRRLAERVKLQQKKTAKILEPVTGQLHDYVTSALGEQQGMIDMSAARAGAASSVARVSNSATPNPALVPTVQPQGPITPTASPVPINFYGDSWLSFFRCADGSAAAAKVGDDNSINSLLSSGYSQISAGPWPDIYAATGWFQTTAGVDWIKANCGSVYIPPPIGPPPPPEGPPPPPDPTAPYPHGIVYHCEGYQDVTAVPIGTALPTLGDGKFLWMPNTPVFNNLDDGIKWARENGAKVLLDNCPLVPTSPPPPPPGCCPPWDLMPYIDKLCKCIRQAGKDTPSDISDPLVFLFNERGEKWQNAARAWYAGSLEDLFNAETLTDLIAMRELGEGR